YVQLVWSLAHGDGARVTLPPMQAGGVHFSPVLYLFVPLGWLAPGAPALLLAQTVIFAAGALAVAGYARGRLGDARLAAGFAVLYLLNPTLHGINIRDVHPTAFAIPLLVAAAWAVDARRFGWAAVAVVLTLAGREDAAVAGVGFGVWLALARRRWAAGAGGRGCGDARACDEPPLDGPCALPPPHAVPGLRAAVPAAGGGRRARDAPRRGVAPAAHLRDGGAGRRRRGRAGPHRTHRE